MITAQHIREFLGAELERIFTLFEPQRLAKRVDELAAVIRPTVEEEHEAGQGLRKRKNRPA